VIILSYKVKLQRHPNSNAGILFLNNYMGNSNIYSKYREIGASANKKKMFNVSCSCALHDTKSVLSDKPGGTISTISLLQFRGRETRKSDCKCRISAE